LVADAAIVGIRCGAERANWLFRFDFSALFLRQRVGTPLVKESMSGAARKTAPPVHDGPTGNAAALGKRFEAHPRLRFFVGSHENAPAGTSNSRTRRKTTPP
jgi:hypothetical protein